MPTKKHPHQHTHPVHCFSNFLDDPLVASSFVVVALITLMLAIIEFTKAISY